MNIYDRFFALAKEKGINECEISYSSSSSLTIGLFHHEIESFNVTSDSSYVIRGIVGDKFGTATSTTLNKDNMEKIIDNLITNAKVIEKDAKAELFKGSEKYHKISTFNKELENVSVNKKKEDLFALEKAIESKSKLIKDVMDVSYSESTSEYVIYNSLGLKLKQKLNYFMFVGGVVVQDGEEVETGYEIFLDNDYSKFDIEELANELVNETLKKLGGKPVESAKMKTVLSRDCMTTLLGAYVGSANAERVQKHMSLFEGKLNEKVASKKVTISDKPLTRSIHARWFDDEGVATYNKDIVKSGVLKTYLYNIETAKKDGVETTGNGVNGGSKIGVSPFYLELKPGKKSLEEVFKDVNNGIYITELQGAHAGLNPTSGNFSLKASGFLIENGELTRPVNLITVSGNLLQLFKDIEEIANDTKVYTSGIATPSVVIKSLSIGGN